MFQNCKVTRLDLSYNQITDAGVARICKVLNDQSCKITILDLAGNQNISDAGVDSLLEAIKQRCRERTTVDRDLVIPGIHPDAIKF